MTYLDCEAPKKCCICGQVAVHNCGVNEKYPMCDDCWNTEGLFKAWLMRDAMTSNIWCAVVGILCQAVATVFVSSLYVNSGHPQIVALVSAILCAQTGALWVFVMRDRIKERRRYDEEYFLARLKGPPTKSEKTGWRSSTGTQGPQGYSGVSGQKGVYGKGMTTTATYSHTHYYKTNLYPKTQYHRKTP